MDRKQIVFEVVAGVSGVDIDELTPESELVNHLCIDSSRALQMLVELEDRFDVEIEDQDLQEFNTVGNIVEAIERHFAG